MSSHFRHHGEGNDDASSSAGSSSGSYETFPPDDMTEEESLQIWLRRSDEIYDQVLRERQQQEQQQQPLGSGEVVADGDRGSAPEIPGGGEIRGSGESGDSRGGGDRGGSPPSPAARPFWGEDPGVNPFPFDDPSLRDAHLRHQQFLDLNRPMLARVRRLQELEREARQREREATRREREAAQQLEEVIQHREALERRSRAEAPAILQDAASLANQPGGYERLLQAQCALAMAVQENEEMKREEEAHQLRVRAAQREEEEHQRWMRAASQYHQEHQRRMRAVYRQVHPGATSVDFAGGGAGAAHVGLQHASLPTAQAREYERLSQSHYAMEAQANDADSRHRSPAVVAGMDIDNNSSSNSMNDSADGDTAMKDKKGEECKRDDDDVVETLLDAWEEKLMDVWDK